MSNGVFEENLFIENVFDGAYSPLSAKYTYGNRLLNDETRQEIPGSLQFFSVAGAVDGKSTHNRRFSAASIR